MDPQSKTHHVIHQVITSLRCGALNDAGLAYQRYSLNIFSPTICFWIGSLLFVSTQICHRTI